MLILKIINYLKRYIVKIFNYLKRYIVKIFNFILLKLNYLSHEKNSISFRCCRYYCRL